MKILANGCSYTFGAGFSRKERESVIYPVLVGQHFDAEVNNVGWPASSNLEIFLRTLREMQSTHYDLIIVQWTTLQRHWFEHLYIYKVRPSFSLLFFLTHNHYKFT